MYSIETPTITRNFSSYRFAMMYFKRYIEQGETYVKLNKVCYNAIENTSHNKLIKFFTK